MLLDTLQEKVPLWLSDDAPESTGAIVSQCCIARNLSDFPFPERCTEEEKKAILDRVVTVLDNLNLFAGGRFYSFEELDDQSIHFLAERRLITYDLVKMSGARGVYVSADQCLSIMVNGADHVCLRVMLPGLQMQDAWSRLNLMDDTLSGVLDYAYNSRLGYLTTSLETLGTGLQASVLLHLPSLKLEGEVAKHVATSKERRLSLSGVCLGTPAGWAVDCLWLRPYIEQMGGSLYSDMSGAILCSAKETRGDLYLLSNQHTLGVSEEEIVFYVGDTAAKILESESASRERLLQESHRGVADRVGRAQGIACGAQVMGFHEGLELLSSLRLGVATGLLSGYPIEMLNTLLISSQSAHLAMSEGGHGLNLTMQRADLFRSRFRN